MIGRAQTLVVYVTCILTTVSTAEGLACPVDLPCACDVSAYDGIEALDVDCRSKDLHSVPMALTEGLAGKPVVNIDFSNNRITSISDNIFSGLTFKQVYWGHDPKITFDGNKINMISPEAFIGISGERLTLSFINCSLGNFPKQQLSRIANLTGLNLKGNSINRIISGDFGPFQKMESLTISNNPLNNLEEDIFDGLQDVIQMIFAVNIGMDKFPRFAFIDMTQLKVISISRNRLTSLPSQMFRGFATKYKAFTLDIAHNEINDIPEDAFDNIDTEMKIVVLRLEDNHMKSTKFLSDPCRKLVQNDKYMTATQVYLNNNPVKCDCDLYNAGRTGMYSIYGTCASPDRMKGVKMNFVGNYKDGVDDVFKRSFVGDQCGELPWDISCKDWRDRQPPDPSQASSLSAQLPLYALVLCSLLIYI